jgi:rhodanese-related sulfurtransferase
MSHATSSPYEVSVADLRSQVGTPHAPLLLDVRREAAFAAAPTVIAGALHVAPEAVEAWAADHARQSVVVYCVHGHEVSSNAARILRECGYEARVLSGGIAAWSAAGGVLARRGVVPGAPGSSRWVTRERPKIDRIACPWLIQRFIDPAARFLFAPPDQVLQVAQACSATPYDVPDVRFTHRGEQCTFDSLIADFGLSDPALDRLARIVRAADTDRLDLVPQAAGLLAISLGLSHNHADDHAMLARAMVLYDALYAWCRMAAPERHHWAAAK